MSKNDVKIINEHLNTPKIITHLKNIDLLMIRPSFFGRLSNIFSSIFIIIVASISFFIGIENDNTIVKTLSFLFFILGIFSLFYAKSRRVVIVLNGQKYAFTIFTGSSDSAQEIYDNIFTAMSETNKDS